MTQDTEVLEQVARWRAGYEDRLRSDWGWLSVTGLYWIDDGVHTVGSEDSADIRLAAGDVAKGNAVPARVATITRQGQQVSLQVLEPGSVLKDGAAAASGPLLFDGSQGERHVVANQSFLVVRRGDRVGVRTWDNDSEQRRQYTGSDWFDADPGYRVEAAFRPYAEPVTVPYMNVIGDSKEAVVSGEWVFRLHDRDFSLVSLAEQDRAPFFVFRDATSGNETYGASRFLSASEPVDGKTILDFNRAYNPPCAFTPHATCPLPPRQNVLDVRIAAGERLYEWP